MNTLDFKSLPIGAIVCHENSKELCTYEKIAHKKWKIKGLPSLGRTIITEGAVIPQANLLEEKGESKRARRLTLLFHPQPHLL